MTHLKEISGYPFSASDLRTVCAAYAEGIVSVTKAVRLDFQVSESHKNAIARLAAGSLRKAGRHAFYRRLAAFAAVFIILFGTIIFTNVHAREAVVRWLRRTLPDYVLYQFFGENSREFHPYTVTWLPEGFELAESGKKQDGFYCIYKNEAKVLLVDFYNLGSYDFMSVGDFDCIEQVTINEKSATLYINSKNNSITLVMVDELRQMTISICATLSREELIRIGESIE